MQKKYFRNTRNLLKRSSYLFLLAVFVCDQGIAALTYYETIGLPLWLLNFLNGIHPIS